MTEQPTEGDVYFPKENPQLLVFKPISDDGKAATFEALVPGGGASGSPVFALTVTIASSVPQDSGKELSEALGQMKAIFEVLPDLPPGFDVSGDEESSDPGSDQESFDLSEQMVIKLRWDSLGDTGPVAFIVTVEATTGIVPVPGKTGLISTDPAAPRLEDYAVTPRLNDYWYATISPTPTAHVKIRGGQGTIRRAGGRAEDVHTPPPKEYKLGHVNEFIMHANTQSMNYTVNSGFYSPQHRYGR